MPRDCSHHIRQAGGCQEQHGHAGSANRGSSRQVPGTARGLQPACNCKQPPGSRRKSARFPGCRGILVHLHQAQMDCSTFKRLISFLFVFKGNVWVPRSPATGERGMMDGLCAWAPQPNPSASNSRHMRAAGMGTWLLIPKLWTGGKHPSNWTSPLLLPRVSNWSPPSPASLCSWSVPYTARTWHLASEQSTQLEASALFPSHPKSRRGSQTLLHLKLSAPALGTQL